MTYRIFPVLLFAALLSACNSAPVAADANSLEQRVREHIVMSGDVGERLGIDSVVSARAGDLLRASVQVKNPSNFAYGFAYRFKWFDANGMEIAPEGTAWTPVSLAPNETRSLQGLAPVSSASTYKLFFQEAP